MCSNEELTIMEKRLLMIVNEDRFFLSHRAEIALSAQRHGWNVCIVCKDTGQRANVETLGLKMIDLPINPTGMSLWQELRTFRFLYRLYSKNTDAVVHHVGLKNILWGSVAARLTKVKGVVNAVSGLGIMFSGEKPSLMARGIMQLLRFSHRAKNVKVIFQNHEDEGLFLKANIVKKEQIEFIKGSGVNLDVFVYTPQSECETIKIIFTARMVKEKGVMVLAEAAELLRSDYEGRVEFLLCGGLSDNPKAMKENELLQLCDGKYIKWLGYCSNVKELLMQSHIVAFPSYYREGVPKSLIEACAIGRPIVTTDSVGCKDTVDDNVNGFLVPIKDSKALADRLRTLIDDDELRNRMGKQSRLKAEKEFSLQNVIDRHLEIYESLL